jgi:hypothetical protein
MRIRDVARAAGVVAGFVVLSAQSYAPARIGSCRTKVAYGIIKMQAGFCRTIGGAMNGNHADADWVDCHLDWCLSGDPGAMPAARNGTCRTRATFGILRTTAADCTRMGGTTNVSAGAGDAVECHLDWCAAGGAPAYVAAAPGTCPANTRAAYGAFMTTASDCRRMAGTSGGAGEGDWMLCYLDWCATNR